MMRLASALLAALLLGGCEQQMAEQPRVAPFEASPVFADGAGVRPPVPGTVPVDGGPAVPEPPTVDLALLERGRQRYDIYCAPCHDYTGHGAGRVVQRGFPQPPDFHAPPLLGASDRHIFDVITGGYGVMYSYASRVAPADRWAIVAYIRALQYRENVPAVDLTADLRDELGGVP
jgi:mono/diheme cytochrome c family protein